MTESSDIKYGFPGIVRAGIRWFGPQVDITMITQIPGVTDVVSALHHVSNGSVWTVAEILKRKIEIEFKDKVDEPENMNPRDRDEFYKSKYRSLLTFGYRTGLVWSTIESLPFTEAIKNGSPERDEHIANYQQSLRNLGVVNAILAEPGIKTNNTDAYTMKSVVGNFMLVADWSRTGHTTLPDGSRALEYNHIHFAAFDIFMGRRHQTSDKDFNLSAYEKDGSYTNTEILAARDYWYSSLEKDVSAQLSLATMIIAGLPGAQDSFAPHDPLETKLLVFRNAVSKYKDMTVDQLHQNIFYFLDKVVGTAKEAGIALCCHPDDPSYSPFLGTPRAVGTIEGYKVLLDHGCGVNLCFGSLTTNEKNRDVMLVVKEIAEHGLKKGMSIEQIFPHVHLRPIETNGKNFREGLHASHIEELYQIVYALAYYNWKGVFRPDHAPDPTAFHRIIENVPGYENALGNRGYSVPGRAMGAELLIGLFHGAYREISNREKSVDALVNSGFIKPEDRAKAIQTAKQTEFEAVRNHKSHIILPPALQHVLLS